MASDCVSHLIIHIAVQILRGPAGNKYESTLAAMSLTSLEPLVFKLGGDLHLMEAVQLEMNGQIRTFVNNIDRPALSG